MAIIFAMDESLKARLIGAAVLVAVAVILIPELLSGRGPAQSTAPVPGESGTRTQIIDIPVNGAATSAPPPTPAAGGQGSINPGTPSGPPAAPADTGEAESTPASVPAPSTAVADTRPDPAPPATATTTASAASRPVVAPPPAPAPAPAVAQPAPPPAAAARGGWAVQVGAFGSTAAAGKVVNELGSAGFRAYVSPVQRSGKTLYRVRVGPEADRSRADATAAALKGRGLPATVVAND